MGVIGTLGSINGGSGYTNGTYPGVALSGSTTGYGAIATIAISGGSVTSVTLTNQGKQFAIGDTLTAVSSALGGTGSGFNVPVSNIAQFSMVMDGQNHWGVSSAFLTTNWPADTYYTFTENNIIGGSLRYYGGAYSGAPLWLGSIEGLRTLHVYLAQQGDGPCVVMFDNNASFTLHNINETLDIQCETSSANYDVFLTGSNASPKVNGLSVIDPLSEAGNAILGVDTNISSVAAHNANINIGFSTANPPLFGIGTAGLWILDGTVNLPFAWEYNAPSSTAVSGVSAGVPANGGGPLDFLNTTANVSGAYSCARRLSYAYSGPLCNVRRGSDSAAVDLFPLPSGAADKTALNAFCANSSCYIATEYDQSGNGNIARNTTASTQPTVTVEGSAMNYAICGVWGSGSNINLSVAGNSAINGLFASGGFASVVTNKTATLTNAMRIISKLSGVSGWELSGAYTLGFGYPQFTGDASSSNGAWVSNTFMPSLGGHIFDVAYSYASLANVPTLGIDGGSLSYQSSTQPTGAVSDANSLVFGNTSAGGFGWPGDICEVVLTRQALTAAQTDAIRRNQAVFYGLGGVL